MKEVDAELKISFVSTTIGLALKDRGLIDGRFDCARCDVKVEVVEDAYTMRPC